MHGFDFLGKCWQTFFFCGRSPLGSNFIRKRHKFILKTQGFVFLFLFCCSENHLLQRVFTLPNVGGKIMQIYLVLAYGQIDMRVSTRWLNMLAYSNVFMYVNLCVIVLRPTSSRMAELELRLLSLFFFFL